MGFAKLTLEDVKVLRDKKIITARGYVYLWLLAAKKAGWKIRGTVTDLCKRMEIPRRTFYQILKDLSSVGVLDFEIHGDVEIWLTPNSEDLVRENMVVNLDYEEKSVQNTAQVCKTLHKCAEPCTDCAELCTDCAELCTETALKDSQGEDLRMPSDLSQIFSTLSLPAHPPERGEEKLSPQSPDYEESCSVNPRDSLSREFPVESETLPRGSNKAINSGEGKYSAGVRNGSFCAVSDTLDKQRVVSKPRKRSEAKKADYSDQELLNFISRSNPEVKNPRAYARACLKNDRDYWEDKYLCFKQREEEAAKMREDYNRGLTAPKPDNEAKAKVNPEEAKEKFRKIREIIRRP